MRTQADTSRTGITNGITFSPVSCQQVFPFGLSALLIAIRSLVTMIPEGEVMLSIEPESGAPRY